MTGPGGEIGDTLCAEHEPSERLRLQVAVMSGEHICRVAGLKRVTMELGSNSPLIVMPDADPEKVARAASGIRLF